MSAIWRGVCVTFLCCVGLLCLAARFPVMDAVTLKLGHPVRSLVATMAVREQEIGVSALDRALVLDPDNAAAWERRCTAYVGNDPAERLADCRRAVSLTDSAANLHAQAAALEEDGDACAAQQAYRSARDRADLAAQGTYAMRDQARAALLCGDTDESLHVLQSAEEIDQRSESDGLATDRNYLAVVYRRINQPEKAHEMCSEANPGYGSCTCDLTASGVGCAAESLAKQAPHEVPPGRR